MTVEAIKNLSNAEPSVLTLLSNSEIDMQVATAHKYPRSLKTFINEVKQMVTLSEEVAQECIYALPRGGKTIEGASARFAELLVSAWGNSRAGARIVEDKGNFVIAQGVFHDLQKNVAITYEVQRRITDKYGKRFSDDMISVTANAACSIALRNAILKGVPKAFWSELYELAKQTARGNVETLPNRRAKAFSVFQSYGVSKETIFEHFGIKGEEDLNLDHLLILQGIRTAIKEGDITPENAFSKQEQVAISMKTENFEKMINLIKSAVSADAVEIERKKACTEALKIKDNEAIKFFNQSAEDTKKTLLAVEIAVETETLI